MFNRELDDHQIVFAMGETIAHLNNLMRRGEFERADDPDGVRRFVRRAAA